MIAVHVLGTASTRFQRWPERDFRDLAREAVLSALADAGLQDGQAIDAVWFGNCAMDVWGQSNIRGQVTLRPLVAEGVLPEDAPVLNVEGACATGSVALHAAYKDVRSGQADLVLAVGVEKVFVPDDPATTFRLFLGGIDQLHTSEWKGFFAEQGERTGHRFEPHPHRVMFLDIHALQARAHMERFGTTVHQLAAVAAKNHDHGTRNPLAQYQHDVPIDAVLADRPVVAPFTRSMCAPVSDGAAAVLLCSDRFLAGIDATQRERALRLRASALVQGRMRNLEDEAVAHPAARKAFGQAGITAGDIDIAEVHDSTAYCELVATEALGLCARGEGGPLAASGATSRDGATPVNCSGGLESKGHPLAATGLSMIHELAQQLRGEAGDKQVPGAIPTVGVQQNAGGLIGFDEALCSVAVLERVG